MRTETGVSRAVNVAVEAAAIRAMCAKKSIEISAIEELLSGGTRVVLVTAEGAAQLRALYKKKLLDGPVSRAQFAARH